MLVLVALPFVEFPLVFEVSDASHTRFVHVGVLEFSCPEGAITLPSWVSCSFTPIASSSSHSACLFSLSIHYILLYRFLIKSIPRENRLILTYASYPFPRGLGYD